MAKYKVIVSLLNVRDAPVADFAVQNVIFKVPKNLILELEEVPNPPNPALGKWYTDGLNQFYSGRGLQLLDAPVSLFSTREAVPWWIKRLEIDTIWNDFNEKGRLAKVAVIDTGYNINNLEIHEGVVGTYLHPSYLGRTTINDNDGHGSYCASIVGARNRKEVIGCAPECQLYISKMSNSNSLNAGKLKDAIEDAILNKVDVISISSGGGPSDDVEQAIKKATDNNIIVVASIGNNESTQYNEGGEHPALYDDCIAIGSADKNNKISLVTLINPKTEINAPGEDISGYALKLSSQKFDTSTSAATAVAAGICALIVSYCKRNGKKYSNASIRDLIVENYDLSTDASSKKIISPIKIFNKLKTS